MKRIAVIGFLALLLVGCTQDKGNLDKRLLGQWTGQGGVTVEFKADRGIIMRSFDEKRQPVVREGLYWVNWQKIPYQLDIDLQNMDRNIATIIKWDADGRLIIQSTSPGDPRPKEFTASAATFTRTGPMK